MERLLRGDPYAKNKERLDSLKHPYEFWNL